MSSSPVPHAALACIAASPRYTQLALNLVLACASLLACGALHAEKTDEIATDRPDFVESSAVVGKGRFQFETSVALEKNRADGARERTLATPTLLRYGISDTVELRLETDGRLVYRADDAAYHHRQHGTGDASIGLKWHTLDAAGAMPSVAVLAHVDTDSGSAQFRGDGLRPSLRAVAEWELANDFSLGVMPGFIVDKDAGGKRFTAGIFGIVVGKSLNERLRGFVEFAAPQIARGAHGGTVANANVGAAYLLSNTVQLDTAFSKGLNQRTVDLGLTIGLSAKF